MDPWPIWLWTQIRPPCSSTDFLAGVSRPLLLAGAVAGLAELLENRCLILGRNRDSSVADGDGDGAFGYARGEADPVRLPG